MEICPRLLVRLMQDEMQAVAEALGLPEFDNEEVHMAIKKLKERSMSLTICRNCGRGWQALSAEERCPFCTKAEIEPVMLKSEPSLSDKAIPILFSAVLAIGFFLLRMAAENLPVRCYEPTEDKLNRCREQMNKVLGISGEES